MNYEFVSQPTEYNIVNVDPTIAYAFKRDGMMVIFGLRIKMQAISNVGSVNYDLLVSTLCDKSKSTYAMSEKALRKRLREMKQRGLVTNWNDRVYYLGWGGVAAKLLIPPTSTRYSVPYTLEAFTFQPNKFDTLQQQHTALTLTAVYAERDGRPTGRSTIQELTGIHPKTQRHIEKLINVTVTPNFSEPDVTEILTELGMTINDTNIARVRKHLDMYIARVPHINRNKYKRTFFSKDNETHAKWVEQLPNSYKLTCMTSFGLTASKKKDHYLKNILDITPNLKALSPHIYDLLVEYKTGVNVEDSPYNERIYFEEIRQMKKGTSGHVINQTYVPFAKGLNDIITFEAIVNVDRKSRHRHLISDNNISAKDKYLMAKGDI